MSKRHELKPHQWNLNEATPSQIKEAILKRTEEKWGDQIRRNGKRIDEINAKRGRKAPK